MNKKLNTSKCCSAIIIGTGFTNFRYVCSKCGEPIEQKIKIEEPYKFSK